MLWSRRFLPFAAAALLAGCANNACNEFAAPHDRDPSHCPIKSTASQAVPPDPHQPSPTAPRYCYSTIGQEECFDTPQPGHQTGYLGTYSPNPPPPAAPATSAPPSSP
jgi:hypothetical protein